MRGWKAAGSRQAAHHATIVKIHRRRSRLLGCLVGAAGALQLCKPVVEIGNFEPFHLQMLIPFRNGSGLSRTGYRPRQGAGVNDDNLD